jgi:hypothetical protein
VEDGALTYGALHVLSEDLKERHLMNMVEEDGIQSIPSSALTSLYSEDYRKWTAWKEKD